MKQGKIFIIAGPSGVGKDTIIRGVMQKLPNLVMIKSYTTRPPRESDEVGNRVFVSEKKFQEMIKKGEMIEWQKVYDIWYYGRRLDDIVRHTGKGKSVIMDVNVDGAVYFEKIMPEVVSIFVKYEKPELFEKRIKTNRPETSEKEFQIRKKGFQREMTFEKYYDYSVINYENHPEKSIEKVIEIVANNLDIRH